MLSSIRSRGSTTHLLAAAAGVFISAVWSHTASAAPPVVSTVPVNPANFLQRHDIISGQATTLKGAVDEASIGSTWTWDPGDGSGPIYSGNVDPNPVSTTQMDDVGYNPYWAVWAAHIYDCDPGDQFNAVLTVDNGVDPPVSNTYRMECQLDTLPTEINAAVDEALWFMHRNQFRFDGTETGGTGGAIPMGRWDYPQTVGQAEVTVSAASVNAFEANGYLETGPAGSPYTDTVKRGLLYVISRLDDRAITPQPNCNAPGDGPDINGNGVGIGVQGTVHNSPVIDDHATYKMGMVMDAIVASGTPGATSTTGFPGVIGRTYGDIIQDMAEFYFWSQGDTTGVTRGGWDYGPNSSGDSSFGGLDNSSAGWAAIGLIAAEDVFGVTIPPCYKSENELALEATDSESNVSTTDGQHGYRSTNPLWGPYGVTGAALVQMSLDDIDATTAAAPDERWVRAENFFRRGFNTTGGSNNKSYYYGMFNFAKAMREAHPAPVEIIGTQVGAAEGGVGCGPSAGCAAAGPQPLDWYADPVDGLAKTMIDIQDLAVGSVNIGRCASLPGGSSSQDDHDTPWCTQILTRQLFEAGPVAVGVATPNPTGDGVAVTLDGSGSFHLDPDKEIVTWEWDLDNDGTYETPGEIVVNTFSCADIGAVIPCSFPVALRVFDNAGTPASATDVLVVEVTFPPFEPVADADGPYRACLNEAFEFDGSGSFDLDEGLSEPGASDTDRITAWDWDQDNDGTFESSGETVAAIAAVTGSLGLKDVTLRVTDNTALAFPSAGLGNLTDEDLTSAIIGDCSCIVGPTARSSDGRIQLRWSPIAGAVYDIWRSTESPNAGFSTIASDVATAYGVYLDTGLTNGTEYHYRVVPKDETTGALICDHSAPASATPAARRRR